MEEIFDIFKRNFPYVSRDDNTIREIISNKDLIEGMSKII